MCSPLLFIVFLTLPEDPICVCSPNANKQTKSGLNQALHYPANQQRCFWSGELICHIMSQGNGGNLNNFWLGWKTSPLRCRESPVSKSLAVWSVMGATLTISHDVAESDLRALLNNGLIHTTESNANVPPGSWNREAENGNDFLQSPALVLGCVLSLRPRGCITFFFLYCPSLTACPE